MLCCVKEHMLSRNFVHRDQKMCSNWNCVQFGAHCMHPTCYITLYGKHWEDDPLGVMINSSKGQAPFKKTKLLSMFAHKL